MGLEGLKQNLIKGKEAVFLNYTVLNMFIPIAITELA